MRTYFISLKRKRGSKRQYVPAKTRFVRARNYIEASKKLNISPYAMRTYGHIKERK